MKLHTFIFSLLLFASAHLSAQFYVGGGVGYFPSGMSTIYVQQSFFLNSSYAEGTDGSITKSRKLMPFHYGYNIGWCSGSNKERDVNFQMSWNNLSNNNHLERTNDSTGVVTVYRLKSRLNTLLFGAKFMMDSEIIEGWSLQGVFTRHTLLTNNDGAGWSKTSNGEADFGVDAGINFRFGRKLGLYLHYTRCFFMYLQYNPSYFGVQLQYKLKRN
ncbi:MAG: hypothetical protein RL007_283 [Bacteroidota bacterium]|jgi:hypothetical protein